jgi:hypothetical protein
MLESVDPSNPTPLPDQVAAQIRRPIANGEAMPGEPSDKPSSDAHPSVTAELEQGVIEEAKRRRRARRSRVALGVLLAAAGIAGLAWAVAGGGSPASSQHAGRSGGTGAARSNASVASGFHVHLSPALDGGQYGWCVGVEEGTGGIGGGGCAMTPVTSMPLAMRMSGGSVITGRYSIVVVTTPQVAAILVNDRRRVPTSVPPGLPYGLRAARIQLRVPRTLRPIRVTNTPTLRHVTPPPPEPTIVALDRQGRPIPNRIVRGRIERPNISGRGPCALRASGLPGLAPQWSHLASAIRPFPGKLVGRAFFSCIDTEYYLQHWPLDAAILLDATHPGAVPAAIPGLTPVSGAPGFFNGPGDFKGELTATRDGNTWLVVAGGRNLAQRIEVLHHLTPTVKL